MANKSTQKQEQQPQANNNTLRILLIVAITTIFLIYEFGGFDSSDSSKPNQQKTQVNKLTKNTYRDGYNHGERNAYNINNAYDYWQFVNKANQSGVASIYILDYNDTWASGYNDGYKGRPAKY